MILVTGGTGFIGGHVVRALRGRGDAVRCLVRASSPVEDLQDLDVTLAVGDVRDARALRVAMRGCRAVYHCAADYRLFALDPTDIYRTNVEGTRNVLEAAIELGVERIVYTGSVGALATGSPDCPADESTPVSGQEMIGHYKRSKWLADRLVEDLAAKGASVVTVCPSTPVGERDVKPTPTGQMIVDFLKGRIPAYVDTGLNLIDVRDVAEGHLLAERHGVPGEKYILGCRNMALREFLDVLADISGRRKVRLEIPHWIPFAIAAVDTWAARVRRGAPRVSLESVRMSKKKMYFSAAKAVRELGLPQTPVEQALERAVTWFRTHGYA